MCTPEHGSISLMLECNESHTYSLYSIKACVTFGRILCGLGACNISAFGRESVVALLIRASLFGMLVVVVVDHAVDESVVLASHAKK